MPSYDVQRFDPPAPVATVTLRTQGGQESLDDVAMLIDSGADVSLIPAWSVQQLGMESHDIADYELEGFDGRRSAAKSVRCELVLLDRVYCGVYLIVEHATGILGRDVLNHMCLVLDGPNLQWRPQVH